MPSLLIGNWILSINAACSLGATFDATGAFSFSTVCVLPNGTIGLETQLGTYETAGTRLSMTSTKATCVDAPKLFVETFTASATQLTMTDTSGVLVFMRNAAAGSGAAPFGCFKMGVFTPAPLAPI